MTAPPADALCGWRPDAFIVDIDGVTYPGISIISVSLCLFLGSCRQTELEV